MKNIIISPRQCHGEKETDTSVHLPGYVHNITMCGFVDVFYTTTDKDVTCKDCLQHVNFVQKTYKNLDAAKLLKRRCA